MSVRKTSETAVIPMRSSSIPLLKIFLGSALINASVIAALAATGKGENPGVFAILFFLSLAGACTRNETFRSFTYTMIILSLVCLAMFFPIRQIGDFTLTLLIVPLLQIIMFTVGSQMSLKDFESVIRTPKAVGVGLVCQFTIMPLVGFSLAHLFSLEPEIAAGLILIGCSASGLASNVMAFLAKANLPLSVTLTVCATLVAPVMTPFLMGLLAGEFVPVDFWDMMGGVIRMVIFPIMAGVLFNALAYGRVARRTVVLELGAFILTIAVVQILLGVMGGDATLYGLGSILTIMFWVILLPPLVGLAFHAGFRGRKEMLDRTMAFASMTGIGVILTIITSAGRDSLMTIGLLLLLACLLHNVGGYLLGYWACRILRMDERTCRTIALEVGQQNGGLASGIAVEMGKAATVGLAPAVFGALMNVTGSGLATWWRRVPIAGDEDEGPDARESGKIEKVPFTST